MVSPNKCRQEKSFKMYTFKVANSAMVSCTDLLENVILSLKATLAGQYDQVTHTPVVTSHKKNCSVLP